MTNTNNTIKTNEVHLTDEEIYMIKQSIKIGITQCDKQIAYYLDHCSTLFNTMEDEINKVQLTIKKLKSIYNKLSE